MIGSHEIVVRNRRLQYKFTVHRNITILRGDSATGKTTLIDMIASYQNLKEESGVTIICDKPCVVLSEQDWEYRLSRIHDSIIFIDEGPRFVRTKEFANAIEHSDNYYVIATRNPLYNLPYSVKEIYGIKNKSGNRYQSTKRLYSEFVKLYPSSLDSIPDPDLVVVEDSHAGFEFFNHYFSQRDIQCISADGKSNIFQLLRQTEKSTILVIADGAAFGPEIESISKLSAIRNIILYLPESFEWMILKSDVLNSRDVREKLEDPASHIESQKYFSWERFFTELLVQSSKGTYLQYNKNKLNPAYLNEHIENRIIEVIPNDIGM